MDGLTFDRLTETITEPRSGRQLHQLLGGAAVGGPLVLLGVVQSTARRKKKGTLCHQGQTISVSSKAKKKHLSGASGSRTAVPRLTPLLEFQLCRLRLPIGDPSRRTIGFLRFAMQGGTADST